MNLALSRFHFLMRVSGLLVHVISLPTNWKSYWGQKCEPEVNPEEIVRCYKRYIGFVVETPPTYKQFIANMEEKMMDPEFTGDTVKLLRPGISYDPNSAWDLVREELIDLIR